jgi:hypothetical protein
MLNVAVAEVGLQGAGVVALVGQGIGFPIPVLKELIEHIQYPGLRLTHLNVLQTWL